MKAQSADYIELQDIYKTKARTDLAEITSKVRSKELELGRKPPVDDREIEAFCKGAAFIKLIRGRPIRVLNEQDIKSWTENASIRLELQDANSFSPSTYPSSPTIKPSKTYYYHPHPPPRPTKTKKPQTQKTHQHISSTSSCPASPTAYSHTSPPPGSTHTPAKQTRNPSSPNWCAPLAQSYTTSRP